MEELLSDAGGLFHTVRRWSAPILSISVTCGRRRFARSRDFVFVGCCLLTSSFTLWRFRILDTRMVYALQDMEEYLFDGLQLAKGEIAVV